jgi:hypothetical protein
MSSLGFYAESVESAPTVTLTATSVVLGGLLGIISGWSMASLAGGNPKKGALWGFALGAAAFGLYGYSEGQELASWLKQLPPPPQQA